MAVALLIVIISKFVTAQKQSFVRRGQLFSAFLESYQHAATVLQRGRYLNRSPIKVHSFTLVVTGCFTLQQTKLNLRSYRWHVETCSGFFLPYIQKECIIATLVAIKSCVSGGVFKFLYKTRGLQRGRTVCSQLKGEVKAEFRLCYKRGGEDAFHTGKFKNLLFGGFDINVKDSATPNLHKADGPMISVTYKGGIFGILPSATVYCVGAVI